jgi:hypothetical protein
MKDDIKPSLLVLENDFLREQNFFYKELIIELLDYVTDHDQIEDLILTLLKQDYPVAQLVYDMNLDEDLVLKVAKLNNYIKET